MSLLGEDFSLFRMFVWHCINFIEGSTKLIPYLDLLIIKLLKVALESSRHCLIYFETMLSTFLMIQVSLISALVRFQEIFDNIR